MEKAAAVWAKARPLLDQAEPYLRKAYPYLVKGVTLAKLGYEKAKPYWTSSVAELVFALVLLFFGGSFAMTIACVQAFRIAGGEQIKEAMAKLALTAQSAAENLKRDPEAKKILDKDGDGEISFQEFFHGVDLLLKASTPKEKEEARKFIYLLTRCVDPTHFVDAMRGFWGGCLAVLATLRSQIANSVSVGTQIGGRVCEALTFYAQPYLYKQFPDHEKWVDQGLRVFCSGLGILISIMLVRVVSAFNSALQGAHILAKVALGELYNRRVIKEQISPETPQGQTIMWSIMALGFLWQLSSGFTLPWFLSLPLFPAVLVEQILGLLAAY